MRHRLFASIICLTSLTIVTAASASGRVQQGPRPVPSFGMQQKQAVPDLNRQSLIRQNLGDRNVIGRNVNRRQFAGRNIVSPFGGSGFVGGSGVTVVNQAQPFETVSTVNINTTQTVLGIRRPPEAAPLLFILPSNDREARQAQRASAAIRSLGSADTTTARIIVVR